MRDGPGHGQVPRVFFSRSEFTATFVCFFFSTAFGGTITCFSLIGETPSSFIRTIEWNYEMHDIVLNRRNIFEHLGQEATSCKGSRQWLERYTVSNVNSGRITTRGRLF